MKGIKRGVGRYSAEYTVSYSDMRGVDLTCSQDSVRSRYSHLENMYRDYDSGTDRLESIPGFRRIAFTDGRINSLFSQKASDGENFIIAHSKKSLYRFSLKDKASTVSPERIATVEDTKSTAFSVGSDLYVMDGNRITVINEEGEATEVGTGKYQPYVPTTYVNGVAHQQINLLTSKFTERYFVSSSADLFAASEHLEFIITDEEKRQCAVAGISSSFTGGTVYIPAYTYIGGVKYRITEITDAAFIKNNKIVSLIISEGLIKIGFSAMRGCLNLIKVTIPNSVTEIGDGAFSDCKDLYTVYLGAGVKKLGVGVFEGCAKIGEFKYASYASDIAKIDGGDQLSSFSIIPNTKYSEIRIKIPIYTPTASVNRVTVDGEPWEYLATKTDTVYTHVTLIGYSSRDFDGKTVEIHATMDEVALTMANYATGIFPMLPLTLSAFNAVTRCTVCESFDGRIFLSGNPRLPNVVIYSERDEYGINSPLYFGAHNFFSDGIGSFPVIGMLSVGDSLAVFKSDDDGCGSIFYHTPKLTDTDFIPKIYPVSNIHSGIPAIGAQASFRDDPVFISKNGLCALSRGSIEPERSIYCRSHNVNPLLLSEDLSSISLARWRGYLAVFAGGRVYLADSRATFKHPSGDIEYEWYLLSGIGTYRGDEMVYKYVSRTTYPEYKIHPEKIDQKAYSDEVNFDSTPKGYVYYVLEDGVKYEVHPTNERAGGRFYPSTASLSIEDEYLIFGTEAGDVCIFNSDMRGTPPPPIAKAVDFDEEEYREIYGRKIHPYYYDFDNHSVSYVARTARDSCAMPHLEKNTVKNSLTVKCSVSGTDSHLLCEVGTDRQGYTEKAEIPSSAIDFSDIDFSAMALCGQGEMTIPIAEKEKRWIEKQISLSLYGFRSPISLGTVAFRFTVKGRIKNDN